MKICCMSDLHGFLPLIEKQVDVLLIAGDVCPIDDHKLERQRKWLTEDFTIWGEHILKSNMAKRIVWVAGNHDFYMEFCNDVRPFTYLEDSSVVIDGIKIHGSPWTHKLMHWAFGKTEEELNEHYQKTIPSDTDILISHSPPRGFGDWCEFVRSGIGSPSLLFRLQELAGLKLCVYGHAHSGHGKYRVNNVECINCSLLDDYYRLQYSPTYIELNAQNKEDYQRDKATTKTN